MVYLMTASLSQPLGERWTRIYMHLFKKFYPEKSKTIIDDKDAVIGEFDKRELDKLKRWLYKVSKKK